MNHKNAFNRRLNMIKMKKTESSPCILAKTNYNISFKNIGPKEKTINLNNSQKFKLNNSSILNRSFLNNSYSFIKTNSNISHKILYDDNIKLKNKLNKLKEELTILKGEHHKKEEEIKKVQKILENSKKKVKEKRYFKILREQNQMIKLKEKFQELQSQIKEKAEENKAILNKIKNTDIEEFENENMKEIEIFKEKIKEYRNNINDNKEYEKELNKSELDKEIYINNQNNLTEIGKEIYSKNNNINMLKDNLEKIKEKYNIMNKNKQKLITYNESVQNSNKILLTTKKKMEDFIMQKPIILNKIKELEKKSEELDKENKENKEKIEKMQNRKNNKEKEEEKPKKKLYKIKIEKNPDIEKDIQVQLYESLIKESKKKQNEYINLFNYYNDYIEHNKNYEKIKEKEKLLNEKEKNKNEEKEEENKDNNNNSAFINYSPQSTNRKNDIIIDKYKDEKKEKEFNDFKLLLSIMFYVKKIDRKKIDNILLNYRTKNYYLENLNDKNKYLLELSQDILNLIKDKNENDINLLKDLFIYLLDEKYKGNKESFLDNIIGDFVENNDLLFNKNDLYEKLCKEYTHNTNSIIEKLKKNNKYISFNDLENILTEEKLYEKNNEEKNELFKYFVYILKKSYSSFDKNDSICDFKVEDIISYFNGTLKINLEKNTKENSKDSEVLMSNEELQKILDNFIFKTKKILEEKNMNIKSFIGENNIKKNDYGVSLVNIYTLFDLLKKSGFELDKIAFSCIFAKYKINENSEDINLNSLERDLNK